MNDNYKKNIILLIIVLLMGLVIIGGTFAYFTYGFNATNGNYVSQTECFNIVYNNGNDITGTLFPSSGPLKGLNGIVSLKISDSCNIYGTATIKLHVDSSVDKDITKNVSSYCISRKTLEKIDGISTKEACTTANGRWMGYSDNYCENPQTLERIIDYTTQSDCTTNGGSWKTWTSSISPLKYAVYSNSVDGLPMSVGYITSSDIGNDIIINNNIAISNTQKNIYIYIWLDGYLTDNSINDLPFSGYISSSVTQRSTPTAYEAISKTIKTDTIDWTVIPTTAQSGVYKTTQDNTDIYYYRGNVNNNNVLYDNKCWKIVRTTKTGGIKMIYNGEPDANNYCGTNTTTSQSYSVSNVKLDGTNTTYAFDSTSPHSADYRQSTIKPLIDDWFDDNVDDSLLETTDFCIDLEASSISGAEIIYKPYERWNARSSTGEPTLNCMGTNKYPNIGKVGLLTMDEVWLAGGVASNNTYYLYNNSFWWLLSPHYLTNQFASVFYVLARGDFGKEYKVGTKFGVRPVISLVSGVKFSGNGTYNNPYIPS